MSVPMNNSGRIIVAPLLGEWDIEGVGIVRVMKREPYYKDYLPLLFFKDDECLEDFSKRYLYNLIKQGKAKRYERTVTL